MEDATLYAGFSRQNITPDCSCPLSGYGNALERMSVKVLDDLYLTCVAITSGVDAILLFSGDLLGFDDHSLKILRAAVTQATDVAPDKIFFTATHTHSGPEFYDDHEFAFRYRQQLQTAAAAAAKQALADCAPAQLLTATKRIPGMNFIRHYVTKEGTCDGNNSGSTESGYIGHAGITDPRMVLVQLKRENKPAILLANWQAHNDNVAGVGFRNVSASYVGKFREKFEAETGMLFCYICGASGNQNPNSLIPTERHSLDWIAYGQKLAEQAIAALPQLQAVEGTAIKTLHTELEAPANHQWDPMLPQAKEVLELWYRTADRLQAHDLAHSLGLSSCYHASAIERLAQLPENILLELNAFTIGDLAFVTSTNEVYSDVGLTVRACAPFETVVFCTGNRGYLPNAAAYHYRSYESDTTLYAKGCCEKVTYELIRMLWELKNS